MQIYPPKSILELLDIDEDGNFILTGSPTKKQQADFDKFIKDYKKEKGGAMPDMPQIE